MNCPNCKAQMFLCTDDAKQDAWLECLAPRCMIASFTLLELINMLTVKEGGYKPTSPSLRED